MQNEMRVRAASFAISAGLLSAAAIAALTATFTSVNFRLPDVPIIDTIFEQPPPPVELPRTQTPPRALPPTSEFEQVETILPTDDLAPLDTVATTDVIGAPYSPPMITNPRWLQRPSGLEDYYPRRALLRGVEGQVVLDCLVTTAGTLNCAVVSETPANWGFAEAALRISRDYRMVPAERDGVPTEGRYRMVAPFRLE
jgi:protein TonB